MTETWLSEEKRSIFSGSGRGLVVAVDVRVGQSGGRSLEVRVTKGVRSTSDKLEESARGDANVARDGRREVIRDMRCVIELCKRRGLEIVCRFESLSLRVPDRNSLSLSLSRIKNSSLRSTLKRTMSEQRTPKAETHEPLYDTDDDTSTSQHPQYSAREYNTEARGGESDGGFDSGDLHSDH
jgi:hypothetical protein